MRIIPTLLGSLALLLIISITDTVCAQTPFEVSLEPVEIDGLGGIQSYAVGQSDGKWLIVGGRVDGLHRRQPWASFDLAGHNDQLLVVDPSTQQVWTSAMTELEASIQEQLRSTNMEFIQEADILYIAGGYGFSDLANDHTTFPNFTAIDVPMVIDAVITESDISPYIRQIALDEMAVTGGYIQKIDDMFYLVGGQRFEGRYNPMDMPTFTQEYTNSIQPFTISDDGVDLSIELFEATVDETNLHRRDFNVVAQIMPDGEQGLTAFSGVFQQDADIPFLNCVDIRSDGYEAIEGFSQYYNHYHCANVPIYSAASNEMHTVFFGGIAQYYDSDGMLVQDNEVPFVNTIARVTRNSDGEMVEYKLPIEMPGLLGSGAEFMVHSEAPQLTNEIIDLDEIGADPILIGYIYGGIESSAPNIFWINTGTESEAHPVIYEVYLNSSTTGLDQLNDQSQGSLRMQVYPNPWKGRLFIDLYLDSPQKVELDIVDEKGMTVHQKRYRAGQLVAGKNELQLKDQDLKGSGIYYLTVRIADEQITQKVIVHE